MKKISDKIGAKNARQKPVTIKENIKQFNVKEKRPGWGFYVRLNWV